MCAGKRGKSSFSSLLPLSCPKGKDADVKRACMAAENVDVAAAGHSKMLAVLVLGPRERPWRVRQVRASVVEKLRAAWVRSAPPGSFDSAPSSAVSRDKSVRRSAQDDDFVRGLRYRWLGYAENTNRSKKSQALRMTALSGGLKYRWLVMQKTRKVRKSHRHSG
jgi:hypothetical protein